MKWTDAEDIALALNAIDVQTVARSETAGATREERLDRAEELGARFLLDGAAERGGGDIRLTSSVARTSDRTTVWSNAIVWPMRPVGPTNDTGDQVVPFHSHVSRR